MTFDYLGSSTNSEFSTLENAAIDSTSQALETFPGEQGGRSPSGALDTQVVLASVIEAAATQLERFSQSDHFLEGIQQAFGPEVELATAQRVIQDFVAGNSRPDIQVLSVEELGSEGAFGGNTVYLADSLLNPQQGSWQQAVTVFQEELGHYFDTLLNPNQDAVGDEGAIFAKTVQGQFLSEGELAALKAENDQGTLEINGTEIAIERFGPSTNNPDNFDLLKWNLDIDGDGIVSAFSDGIMVVRYLFGSVFPGDSLTDEVMGPNATRPTTEVRDYIRQGVELGALDIDGDNIISALSDGLIIVRYLLGSVFVGDALTDGVIGSNATRTTAEIRDYLAELEDLRPATVLSFSLESDTGSVSNDSITQNPSIVGQLTTEAENIKLMASFAGQENPADITPLLNESGEFSLSQQELESVFGSGLIDADYQLTLQVQDESGTELATQAIAFTVDQIAPILQIESPIVAGVHSPEGRLVGSVTDASEIASLTYRLDGGETQAIALDSEGRFNLPLSVTAGLHQLQVNVVDIAGNETSQTFDFSAAAGTGVTQPNGSQGWYGKTDTSVVLGEANSIVSEAFLEVTLGQEEGSRTLSFDVQAIFDGTDVGNGVGDRLLVYLVDAANPDQTLLDMGVAGSAVFSLSETGADYQSGVVRYNGTTVEIDTTAITATTDARLVFQLLNFDGDTQSFIRIDNLENTLDETGQASPIFPVNRTVVEAGAPLTLTELSSADDLEISFKQVRFDPDTGTYRADLQLKNIGTETISRRTVIRFSDLPTGVTIQGISGTDEQGNPYVNLAGAIASGGLKPNASSNVIEVVIENPNFTNLTWQIETLTAGISQAPVLATIPELTVKPGTPFEYSFAATDTDGDFIQYSIRTDDKLPTGLLRGDGTLVLDATPTEVGTYTFEVVATDGVNETSQSVTLNVIEDPIKTTRLSGIIENITKEPLVGVRVTLGSIETTTDAAGRFFLEVPEGEPLPSDTLKIYADALTGDEVYPFLAEKLDLTLGHEPFLGVENVIERPIYLPPLDIANGQTINPNAQTVVTTEAIPGAAVTVPAGSLLDQAGQPFTGTLSITEVPLDLTPLALPPHLSPDMVVTIQPGEMLFSTPAPLSLPNLAGYGAGVQMDLWSIDPATGDFAKVGVGQVSADGSVIETIEGGIVNSSWHFFSTVQELFNLLSSKQDCQSCGEAKEKINSAVTLNSGGIEESHNLASYQSLGVTRGVQLNYDSLRADARPIVQVDFGDINPSAITPGFTNRLRLMAELTVHGNDGFDYQVPGFAGGQYGLDGGEHFWSIGSQAGPLNAALQADLRDFESGVYDFSVSSGIRLFVRNQFVGTSRTEQDQLVHVNTKESVFGAGWGITGVQELVENADGSILLIDGDGSELLFGAADHTGIYGTPVGDFSTLEKLADGTFRRTMKDQMVYQFNAQNRLISVTDRNGNRTQHLYENDLLTKIIDPVGLETTFSYTNGKVTSITDPADRTTQLLYDGDGNLIQIIDPDQSKRVFGYDDQHHMTSEIDKRGNREETIYNFAGRAIQGIQKDGSVIQVQAAQTQGLYEVERTASPFGSPVVSSKVAGTSFYSDQDGNASETMLDAAGQAISSIDSSGKVRETSRNAQNLVVRSTDANGFSDYFTYDDLGNVLTIKDEISNITKNVLFSDNFDLENAGVGQLRYNTLDNWTVENGTIDLIGISSSWTSLAPFDNGLVIDLDGSSRDAARLTTKESFSLTPGRYELKFDLAGNQRSGSDIVTVSLGNIYRETFNISAYSPWQTITRDIFVSESFGEKTVKLTFDHSGGDNIGILLDNVQLAQIDFTQDSPKELVYTEDFEDGIGAEWSRSTLDNSYPDILTRFTGRFANDTQTLTLDTVAGEVYELEFDIYSIDSWDGNEYFNIQVGNQSIFRETFRYYDNQLDGRPADLTSADFGNIFSNNFARPVSDAIYKDIKLQFIATGSSTEIDFFGEGLQGVFDESWGIDNIEVSLFESGNIQLQEKVFTYDSTFNQLTSHTDELGRQTLFDIDETNGNIRSETRVVGEIGGDDDQVTFYTYTANGLVDLVTDPLGRITDYDYDAFGRVKQITFAKETADQAIQKFEYDAAGNRKVFIDENGNRTEYVYDELNRLINLIAADPDGDGALESPITNLIYDDAGNIASIEDAQGNTTQFEYDVQNRQTSIIDALQGQIKFEYDNSGNVIAETDERGNVTRYRYDARDRLIATIDPEGRITQLNYDGNNNLISLKEFIEPTETIFFEDFESDLSQWIGKDSRNGQFSAVIVDDPLENDQAVTFNEVVGWGDIYTITSYESGYNYRLSFDYLGLSLDGTVPENAGGFVGISGVRDQQHFSWDWFVSTDGGSQSEASLVDDGLWHHYSIDFTGLPDGNPFYLMFEDARNLPGDVFFDNIRLEKLSSISLRETTFAYDSRDRLIRETDAEGNETFYEYDVADNLTAIIDRNGNRTEFRYDDLNRLIEAEDARNQVSTQAYDLANNLTSHTDELGRIITYKYDDRNRLTQVNHPSPFHEEFVQYTYDGVGNLLSATDELGRTTSYRYDGLNRQISVLDPLGYQTQYQYDANDNLTAVIDALGRTTRLTYDKLNRQRTQINALGGITTTGYDASNNVISLTDEVNRTTTFEYDSRNLLTKVIDPLGNISTTTYDILGRAISATNALGNTTTSKYDNLDRLIETKDATNAVTTYNYDAVGNLTEITDALQNQTTFDYDELNRLTSRTTNSGAETFKYDAVGNQLEIINRNGKVRKFEYDSRDRLTDEYWLDESETRIYEAEYDYNAASELTRASDNYSTYTYKYDLNSRLKEIDNHGTLNLPHVVLNYGYNNFGDRLFVKDTINGQLNGTETFTYDDLSRVISINQTGINVTDKRVTFSYNAASQLTGITRYSDLEATNVIANSVYKFDLAGRLEELEHLRGNESLAFYRFEYDNANRLKRFESVDGSSDFTYNDRDELTASDHDFQENESYSYDAQGNRTNDGYVTDPENQLQTDGTYNYTYDNEGNRLTRIEIATNIVDEYGWDHRNRLVSIITKDNASNIIQSVEYTYDIYNRRILKVVDSDGAGANPAATEAYVYDGEHIALVFDGDGNQTHRYLHGSQVDQVLAEETAAGEVRWALTDHQGSVRDVIDNNGEILNHIIYDSFGNITSETNAEVSFRFSYTGREFDQESGQYFYRARYYDAAIGQFINEDTIGFAGGDTNLYRYVGNSPLNYIDPSGNSRVSTNNDSINYQNYSMGFEGAFDPDFVSYSNLADLRNPSGMFDGIGQCFLDCIDERFGITAFINALADGLADQNNAIGAGDISNSDNDLIDYQNYTMGLDNGFAPDLESYSNLSDLDYVLNYAVEQGKRPTALVFTLGHDLIGKKSIGKKRLGDAKSTTSFTSWVLHDIYDPSIPEHKAKFKTKKWTPMFGNMSAKSTSVASVSARWFAVLGWVLLAVDAALIANCARKCEDTNICD